MLRLNTIVRSYRAGDDVIFSMPEKNGLFLVLSGGVRVFIATDTGREKMVSWKAMGVPLVSD